MCPDQVSTRIITCNFHKCQKRSYTRVIITSDIKCSGRYNYDNILMMHMRRPTSVLSCNKVHESDLAAHLTSKLLSSDKTLAQQNSGGRGSALCDWSWTLNTTLRSDGLQRDVQDLLEAAAAEDGEAGGQCPPPVIRKPRCKQEIPRGPGVHQRGKQGLWQVLCPPMSSPCQVIFNQYCVVGWWINILQNLSQGPLWGI